MNIYDIMLGTIHLNMETGWETWEHSEYSSMTEEQQREHNRIGGHNMDPVYFGRAETFGEAMIRSSKEHRKRKEHKKQIRKDKMIYIFLYSIYALSGMGLTLYYIYKYSWGGNIEVGDLFMSIINGLIFGPIAIGLFMLISRNTVIFKKKREADV